MIDGVLRILIVSVGLLLIWWLCGPTGSRGRAGRQEEGEVRGGDVHVDTQGR